MKIQDLFVADVTRDIPPVVYFHEQSPGEAPGRGRRVHHHRRLPRGRPARPAAQGRHPRAVRPPAPRHRARAGQAGRPGAARPPGSPASTAPASRASRSCSASLSTTPGSRTARSSRTRCSRATTRRGARSCVDAWKALRAADRPDRGGLRHRRRRPRRRAHPRRRRSAGPGAARLLLEEPPRGGARAEARAGRRVGAVPRRGREDAREAVGEGQGGAAGGRPLLARAARARPRALPRPDELDRLARRLADRRRAPP